VRAPASHPGQRHTPGWYWSATTGDLLASESFLERQWLTLLDFDHRVVAMSTQPLELHGADGDGRWRHVPDVFTRRSDGSVRVVDVKNPTRLGRPEVVRQAARTGAACRVLGWEYAMVGAPPQQRYVNISWLAGYRRPLRAGLDVVEEILAGAAESVRLADLHQAAGSPELALPVVFHLLWHGRLVCDLDQPLLETSIVSTPIPSTATSTATSMVDPVGRLRAAS
jgi:hypothetical protein